MTEPLLVVATIFSTFGSLPLLEGRLGPFFLSLDLSIVVEVFVKISSGRNVTSAESSCLSNPFRPTATAAKDLLKPFPMLS